MIKELSIRNFLSHKKTKLEFSNGVNVIVGESDAGKSAIIRALKWCLQNRPTGSSFRSTWGGTTSVGIKFDNGYVLRTKRDKENQYSLDDNSNTFLFNAVSSAVPQEVQDLSDMNDINLQNQFDSHYLLSRSPGEISSHFNKVAHLDQINVSISDLSKQLRSTASELTIVENQIDLLADEMSSLDGLNDIEKKTRQLQLKKTRMLSCIDSVKNIRRLIDDLDIIEESVSKYDFLKKDLSWLDMADVVSRKKTEEYRLSSIISQLYDVNEKEILYATLDQSEQLAVEVSKKVSKYDFLNVQMGGLGVLIERLEDSDDSIISISTYLKKLEKDFHKNMGEICPLCGTKIK